ncbi:hypothetical protein L2E82_25046 [Cichorium intybus]|uniref:Uncharacterized protein n=1 Tax=Cichorium intybus TaxID=13427 RepID=A0ACB9E352_CICIN|nr:hypothetical protein L2E82_25046 [Cichorium intybus]
MPKELSLSMEKGDVNEQYDDDGRIRRTGTLMSASAHIITAVIGSGVLSLAWCFGQLGWIAGTASLVNFAVITWFTCLLLSDCYRSPDPDNGTRNYNYMQAVKANLGGLQYKFCGVAQYGILIGATIGYTITSAISMAAIKRSNCFHKHGHRTGCHTLNNSYLSIFAVIEIILSQIPNFHKLSIISILATIMSFTYASIGIGLSIARIADGGHPRTSVTGIPVGKDMPSVEKMWSTFSAIGDIAFAYSFCPVLLEIQDTLKSSPAENKVMKKASTVGVSASTLFYMILFIQPFFAFVENWSKEKWPQNRFIIKEYSLGKFKINIFRLTWRSAYVVLATLVAMIFPFFNSFLGLIGATTFWPLTVYFPIEMYISQAKIPKNSFTWIWMKVLSLACLIVSLVAAAGSIQGLIVRVR